MALKFKDNNNIERIVPEAIEVRDLSQSIKSDPRMTNARAPMGPAGGSLTDTYPNPAIAANAVGISQIADNAVTPVKVGAGLIASGSNVTVNRNASTGVYTINATNGGGGDTVTYGTGLQRVGNNVNVNFAPSGLSSSTQAVRADDVRLAAPPVLLSFDTPSLNFGVYHSGALLPPFTTTLRNAGLGASGVLTLNNSNTAAFSVLFFSTESMNGGTTRILSINPTREIRNVPGIYNTTIEITGANGGRTTLTASIQVAEAQFGRLIYEWDGDTSQQQFFSICLESAGIASVHSPVLLSINLDGNEYYSGEHIIQDEDFKTLSAQFNNFFVNRWFGELTIDFNEIHGSFISIRVYE